MACRGAVSGRPAEAHIEPGGSARCYCKWLLDLGLGQCIKRRTGHAASAASAAATASAATAAAAAAAAAATA